MVRPHTQRLTATITFSYDAEVFDGDPTDAFEIADLETRELETAFEDALEGVTGDVRNLKLKIIPE